MNVQRKISNRSLCASTRRKTQPATQRAERPTSKSQRRHFVRMTDRPHQIENVRAPRPLDEAALMNPLARNYFFTRDQIQLPEFLHAFDATVSLLYGSGFLISHRGHVATSAHVLKGEELASFPVYWQGERIMTTGARIVAWNDPDEPGPDLAILHLPELSGLPYLRVSRRDPPIGRVSALIGHPQILSTDWYAEKVTSIGNVLGDPIELDGNPAIITDHESGGGCSGGPVVDLDGSVIGVLYASLEYAGRRANYTRHSYIVPATSLRKMMAEARINP